MSAGTLYRIGSVLLVLFAVGHTLGFRSTKGMVGAETVVNLMKSARFTVQGFERNYYGFYVGFGLFVTVFLLFAAALTWQLGGLAPEALARVPSVATWGMAACFVAIAVITWRFFFIAPDIFSTVIAVVLGAAAWKSGQP